jgi:hypothetical protein
MCLPHGSSLHGNNASLTIDSPKGFASSMQCGSAKRYYPLVHLDWTQWFCLPQGMLATREVAKSCLGGIYGLC